MESTGIVPTMPIGGADGFTSGSGFWIFALLILLFGANGNFFGGRNGNAATQSDVVYTSAFNQLQDENTAIRSDIQRTAYDVMGTVKDAAYNNLSEIRDLQAQVNAGFAANQTCCCEIQKEILSNRYEGAINTSAITAAVHAEGEATRNLIQSNKIADLTNEVNELKTQSLFCGVPKINPYFYGVYPYTCGCNGNNNLI